MAAAALLVAQREFAKSIAGCPTFSGDSPVPTGTAAKLSEYITKLGTRLFLWVNRFGINQDGALSSLADFTQTMFHSHFAHVIFS